MKEPLIKRDGDFTGEWNPTICSDALADLSAASGQVGDCESTAIEHEFWGKVVGVDGDGGWVVGGYGEVEGRWMKGVGEGVSRWVEADGDGDVR